MLLTVSRRGEFALFCDYGMVRLSKKKNILNVITLFYDLVLEVIKKEFINVITTTLWYCCYM